jgi:hypothetical protein
MLKLKSFVVFPILAAMFAGTFASTAQAGPLYDWLWKHHYNKLMCCAPQSFKAGACPQPACGQPATCQTTCTQTCQRVVVNYVPCTAYRTNWEQVPVTQFQKTCSTDPCTGCQVTCMKPCTTYTWQMKRVPYTTYRPVYRTETFSVPITYTAMAAPSACNSCPTCPTASVPQTGCSSCAPTFGSPVITGMPTTLPPATLSTSGSFTLAPQAIQSTPFDQSAPAATSPYIQENSTAVPADQVPALGKPIIIDRREITPDSSSFQAPALTPSNTGLQGVRPIQDPNPGLRWDNRAPAPNLDDQTAAVPTRQRWEYSPVRLASHTQVIPVDPAREGSRVVRGDLQIESRQSAVEQVNSAWKNLD